MDVETVFRAMFGIRKESDIAELIEAAVSVAALNVPEKLKKHRNRILKLLFDEDPANSTDLFSDDELVSDDDDDEDKLTVTPKNVGRTSPEIKKTAAAPPTPPLTPSSENVVKLMEATTKEMVGRKNSEEAAEKNAKRKKKMEQPRQEEEEEEVDFPQPKKHCSDRSKAVKPPCSHVRIQRALSRMKSQHCKPKHKMLSGLI